MASRRITKRLLDSLTNTTGKDQFLRDQELKGFAVKISAKGTISFVAEGRIRYGKSKRVTLGRYPLLSVTEARAKAHEALKLFREGVDPHDRTRAEIAQKARQRALEDALSVSLREVLENFLKARRLKSEAGYRNTLKNCFGDWLDQPIRAITRQAIEQRYHHLAVVRGIKAQAAKGMRYLSSLMNFAKAELIDGHPLITENPVAVLRDKKIDRSIKSKERFIRQDQLFPFIRGLITECTPDARDVLLLMLMTGLRDNEAKGLAWPNVNLDNKTFTIINTKNATDHCLPMGGFVYSMLLTRYHHRASDQWVFPSPVNGGHLQNLSKQIRKVTDKTGIAFTAHDLRRTFATLLNELNINDVAISRLMNHKSSNITERYIQTASTLYIEPLNKLHMLIAGKHDWASDAGEHRLPELIKHLDGEVISSHLLMNVLYGESLKDMIKTGHWVDFHYIDAEYHPLCGKSYLEIEQEESWQTLPILV